MLVAINRFFRYMGWDDCVVKTIKTQPDRIYAQEKELTRDDYRKLIDTAKNEGMIFHFDIMNNPNSKSCELAAACSEKKKNEWENIYHSIGNMTPIPWFKIDMNHYINGQLLHKSLDEKEADTIVENIIKLIKISLQIKSQG